MANTNFFITSDTYFGRKGIISISKRPYSSVDEMDADMIKRWNAKVSPTDFVYHLGNFAWDPITADNVLRQLNGHIIFLTGSRDKALLEIAKHHAGKITFLVGQLVEIPKAKMILCRYPLEDWSGKDTGIIHYHGYSMKKLQTDLTKMNRINICCDCWNLAPIAISDIEELIKEFREVNEKK